MDAHLAGCAGFELVVDVGAGWSQAGLIQEIQLARCHNLILITRLLRTCLWTELIQLDNGLDAVLLKLLKGLVVLL